MTLMSVRPAGGASIDVAVLVVDRVRAGNDRLFWTDPDRTLPVTPLSLYMTLSSPPQARSLDHSPPALHQLQLTMSNPSIYLYLSFVIFFFRVESNGEFAKTKELHL